MPFYLVFFSAVAADYLYGYRLDFYRSALGKGSLRRVLQVMLYAGRDYVGQFAYPEVDGEDALCARGFGLRHRAPHYLLGYRKLVHRF